VIVVGGGAAGMIAAIFAARNGARVTLFEKNEKLGRKLYITGKGRCNLTNSCDMEGLFDNVMSNPSFLYSAFYGFSNADAISFFEKIGMKTKVERGNRVFPLSDRSSSVIEALASELKACRVRVCLDSAVDDVHVENGRFKGVMAGDRHTEGDACIIATGGISYPGTGSDGDGHRFARQVGHGVTRLYPSLTGIRVKEEFVRELEGLSLRNVRLSVSVEDGGKLSLKPPYDEMGEMLFTHDGISGPLVLSASSHIPAIMGGGRVIISIDLKPALTEDVLDKRILRDFGEMQNKYFKNSLNQLLPQKMIHVIIKRCQIDGDTKVNVVTREERRKLVRLLKHFTLEFDSLCGYDEAVVTKGGIDVKEVNPSTMESKIVKGLYFAGEVLDVDALTGGFNLQIAWSTGRLAGVSAAQGARISERYNG